MLLIGDLAQRASMAPSAIRYYEEIGLVSSEGRKGGRRQFAESAANRLRAISAAREAGFTLDEIRRLLDSQSEGTDEWKELVAAKALHIRTLIERLEVIERTLQESLDCGCRAWDECPVVVR